MRSGALNKRVVIQSAAEAQDSFGEADKTWVTYATRWASVEPIQGREYWSGNQTLAEQSYVIKLRYDSTVKDITQAMRVSWNSQTFDILTVTNPENANEQIHLMCKVRL